MLPTFLLLFAQLAPVPHRRHAAPPPVEAPASPTPYVLPDPPRGGREPARYRGDPLDPLPPLPAAARPAAAWALTVDIFALARTAAFALVVLLAWQRWQRRAARRGMLAPRPPLLRARVTPPVAIEPQALDPAAPVLHAQSAPDPVPTFAQYAQPQPLALRTSKTCRELYRTNLVATLASLFRAPLADLHTKLEPERGEAVKWRAWLGGHPERADTLNARGATEAAALKALARAWQSRHGTWGSDAWTRIAVERHGGLVL